MGTLSVSVPDGLREQMIGLEEINWSAVARKAFEEKIKQIELFKKIVSRSKLTEKDAEEISRKISENMAKRFQEIAKR